MRQQAFGFILEARNEPLVRLDREREQEAVKLMAVLLIAVFEARGGDDVDFDESV